MKTNIIQFVCMFLGVLMLSAVGVFAVDLLINQAFTPAGGILFVVFGVVFPVIAIVYDVAAVRMFAGWLRDNWQYIARPVLRFFVVTVVAVFVALFAWVTIALAIQANDMAKAGEVFAASFSLLMCVCAALVAIVAPVTTVREWENIG